MNNVQLTQAMLDDLIQLGIHDNIVWDGGVTNASHIALMATYGIETPQYIIDYVNSPPTTAVVVETETVEGYSAPIFKYSTKTKFGINNNSITFSIFGAYFNPGTQVTSDDIKITNVFFEWENELKVTVNTQGFSAGEGSISLDGNKIFDIQLTESTWFDFRENGTDVSNFDMTLVTEETLVRDANGIGTKLTTGGWGKMVGVTDVAISRDHDKGCRIIYYIQDTGSSMFGLMADGHGVDTSMYNEMHAGLYPQNQNTLWGFYAYSTRANSRPINQYDRLKFVMKDKLVIGAGFAVYGLVEGEDWEDGEFIYEDVLPNGTQDPGDKIYPCIVPNNGVTARLQAFSPTAE